MNQNMFYQLKVKNKIPKILLLGIFCILYTFIFNTVHAAQFSVKTSKKIGDTLFQMITLKNDQFAFASVKKGNKKQLAVLKNINGSWNVQRYVTFNATNIHGIGLTPNEFILAVALDHDVAFLNTQQLLDGHSHRIPAEIINLATTGETGTLSIVAAKDNKHFFIADEYARFKGVSGIGDVAIVSAQINSSGNIQGKRLGYIKTGQNTIPDISLSPDGNTLYILNEVATKNVSAGFSGSNNTILSKQCANNQYNGAITIVDVNKAISLANQNIGNGLRVLSDDVILANVASGCNAVRAAPSPDGKTVWVTVRGSKAKKENSIFVYDAEFLRNNPQNAFLYSFNSGGQTPIGITVFAGNKYLAVANSNRHNVKNINGQKIPANISIFDISNKYNAKLVQKIAIGTFPRNISKANNENTIYVADYSEGKFYKVN